MRKFTSILLGSVVSLLVFVGGASVTNAANTSATSCTVSPVNPTSLYEIDRNFTYNNDGTVTAKFKVEGNTDCKKDVVFASWEAPSRSGYPLKDQKLFDYKTANFGVGVHELTIKLPDCYWQLDLLEGTNPTAEDGSADYGFGKVHMLDTAHGGTNSCTETPVTPEVPETPVTPTPTPTTPAVVTKEVVSIPSTGAGSIIAGTMGLSTSAGLAVNLIRRKKLGL